MAEPQRPQDKPKALTAPHREAAAYFKGLSTAYGRQTGDSTYNVALQFLSKLQPTKFSSSAVIHDNACGIGTASLATLAVVIRQEEGLGKFNRIEATDLSEPMINQLKAQVERDSLSMISPAVADSHSLPFPDDTFTLSITNISVTNFSDPGKALKEVYRTIRPTNNNGSNNDSNEGVDDDDGLAIVSTWKRFGVSDVMHRAQQIIKGDEAKLIPVPQKEFMADGYLRDRMIEAGFQQVHSTSKSPRFREMH